ncbi:MAG TPA: aldehyde dehydrogenase [Gillisia sp.]|nr:aldehyde dehydrogenase [Gillisia sp.]
MKETAEATIGKIHEAQQQFFATHQSKDLNYRIQQLKKLRQLIRDYEERIKEALWLDLHKSKEEAYLTEISIVTQELDLHIKNLKKWSKPKKVPTPLQLKPTTGKVYYEPLGVALIIAPWNYPFQLLINPLVGAIAAGCCAILKPSEFTTHIALVMEEMINENFDENYVKVVTGGQEVGEDLLRLQFDMIFFTGSTRVGKIVMKAAAQHLTPLILELGGKSPCIVDEGANLDIAAKRIAWGKTINAGQTCIAPDYLLVHSNIRKDLLPKIKEQIENMFGKNIAESDYYGRIVNNNTFNSLTRLLDETGGKIFCGGETRKEDLFIAPTIIENVTAGDALMQEEIFGPLLPVIEFKEINEAIDFINSRPKPLALYYFGDKKKAKNVLQKTSSGGASINDTLIHIGNHNLPFGGVGNSGFGKYHGKESFLIFSNQRAVANTPTWIDFPFKYAPFRNFKYIKKLLG